MFESLKAIKDIFLGKPWYLYPKYSNDSAIAFLCQLCGLTAGWIIGGCISFSMTTLSTDIFLVEQIVGWLIWMVICHQCLYWYNTRKLKKISADWFRIVNDTWNETHKVKEN